MNARPKPSKRPPATSGHRVRPDRRKGHRSKVEQMWDRRADRRPAAGGTLEELERRLASIK